MAIRITIGEFDGVSRTGCFFENHGLMGLIFGRKMAIQCPSLGKIAVDFVLDSGVGF